MNLTDREEIRMEKTMSRVTIELDELQAQLLKIMMCDKAILTQMLGRVALGSLQDEPHIAMGAMCGSIIVFENIKAKAIAAHKEFENLGENNE